MDENKEPIWIRRDDEIRTLEKVPLDYPFVAAQDMRVWVGYDTKTGAYELRDVADTVLARTKGRRHGQ